MISVIFGIVAVLCFLIIQDELKRHKQGKPIDKKAMSITIIVCIISIVIFFNCIGVSSNSSSSSSSSKNWEEDANDAGYYKKNGKWYYQGTGAY
ncbi:MAG: hypothetical protein LUI12_07240 [Clostridiales bacterium]|nr:hypothetical protein [Clostridiales bacterium]